MAAVAPAAKGSADYDVTEATASYEEDNQLAAVTDGESRPIELAVPRPEASATTRFAAEAVSAHFQYDRYGRVTQGAGGGAGAPVVRLGYGADARGRTGAGLLTRVERGAAFSQTLSYDEAGNVERAETSQGTASRADHDTWDRPVREVTGLSLDGRFAPVGAGPCGEGEGAVVERAFDAAGHVVRERRLQDYVHPADGVTRCRWVESRFRYNAREQLVAIEQTQLASTTPGQVVAEPQQVSGFEYDLHGRLESERAEAVSRPHLVTAYTYDQAGRVATVRKGEEGARRLGYDPVSRVVFATDGHEGTWRGRYDAWGRLFHEEQATGAVVRRRFDRAGNPVEETVFDADPLTTPGARVLSHVQSHVTSFGAVERAATALVEGVEGTPAELRVTEKVFDGSGRVIEVWSGPQHPDDASRVDRSRGRREVVIDYEPGGGRVLVERFGGDDATPPLYGTSYTYAPLSAAPWPDAVTRLETVPGADPTELVETFTTAFRRDAFGRPVEERRSDGSLLVSTYDRTGGAIRSRTGAGTEASTSFDGRGLPLQATRPNGRGATLYAYDLDGALLREVVRDAGTGGEAPAALWETVYAHDATGRLATITYADGTSETLTYNADSTVLTRRTRDGLLVTYDYDAANRLESVTPAVGEGGATPTLLDAGDRLTYDRLSRPTALDRGRPGVGGYDPALAVRYPGYDLGSRPQAEVVGGRTPLAWRYDTWNRPVELTLPLGPGRAAGGFEGFARSYDTLDRLSGVVGLGAGSLSPTPLGATWTWGGADRLYGVTTRGALQTAARYGYHGGAGPQVPGGGAAGAEWKLATLTWGSAGATTAPALPQVTWGSFGFGWRGHEGDPADGAKIGRQVLPSDPDEPDLFAGLGWSWSYDGGVRLVRATAGAGDLLGLAPPAGSGAESFTFGYGEGDQLERLVREATGDIAELETGAYGRILSRNGAPFRYDGVGRRLEDDRFVYRWDWRGQLVAVTVKEVWPPATSGAEPEVTPWAGHQVRYDYDAAGRLLNRWHWGKLPEGATDDGARPFIEKRVFVWEGASLAAEAAYGDAAETIFRWRKTYVPGPSGLDDAVQVVVEIGTAAAGPFAGTVRTYTLLRDELGTVVGLVAEDEGSDPQRPPVPVRYRYTPYGEAHAETGPELLRARFDGEVAEVEVGGATMTQVVADPAAAAEGALVLDWAMQLDLASALAGLRVERLATGSGWVPLAPEEVAVGIEPEDGGLSSGGGGPPARLLVLATSGWTRGASYRVRLTPELTDDLGRSFGRIENLEWRVPEAPATGPTPAVAFDKTLFPRYASWEAAMDPIGGRFPAGQTVLFQGLWTDPVTGIAHARARWYDGRNAAWLSEDPLLDVDSPNLYAYVGHHPHSASDPLGLREATTTDLETIGALEDRIDRFDLMYEERGVAGTTLIEAEIVYPRWYDPGYAELRHQPRSYLATDDATYERLRSRLERDLDSFEAAVAEADEGGEIEYSAVSGNYYTYTAEERARDARFAAALQLAAIAVDVATAKGGRGGRGSLQVMPRRGKPAAAGQKSASRTRATVTPTSLAPKVGRKRGPSTDPNAPHNTPIRRVASQVADGEVIAGGGVHRERLIPTPGGYKEGRRPDILVRRPDGSLYGINVGRANKKGVPVRREREAIEDLEGAGVEMHFVPYN